MALGQVVSLLGKTLLEGLRGYAEQNNIKLEGLPKDPKAEIPPEKFSRCCEALLRWSSRCWLRPLGVRA